MSPSLVNAPLPCKLITEPPSHALPVSLEDYGWQYLNGTTDVPRTRHFRELTSHEKSCVTLVLKRYFALDVTAFPTGTTDVSIVVLVICMTMSVALLNTAVLNYVRVHILVKACFSNATSGPPGNNGSGCEWLPRYTVELGTVL